MGWMIEHKDGRQVIGVSGTWWVWTDPSQPHVRAFESEQEARDVRELLPWRVKKDVRGVREGAGVVAPERGERGWRCGECRAEVAPENFEAHARECHQQGKENG